MQPTVGATHGFVASPVASQGQWCMLWGPAEETVRAGTVHRNTKIEFHWGTPQRRMNISSDDQNGVHYGKKRIADGSRINVSTGTALRPMSSPLGVLMVQLADDRMHCERRDRKERMKGNKKYANRTGKANNSLGLLALHQHRYTLKPNHIRRSWSNLS